ncbi:hypothetical protein MA16_Dca016928 [Dendrobium catenatum]|uniref:Uncharacterized protein n=1 Tax=Dendrobium catenatum TaxID=906689 RepID=A0A2I0VWJ3_9ASPA|nr:hypothetical protein MA16_Dca016928 [Dendrobium catenatum]
MDPIMKSGVNKEITLNEEKSESKTTQAAKYKKNLEAYNDRVVSYDFKKERFSDLHRSSIRFPEERFFFVGTPTTPDSKDAAMAGEAIVRAQFQVDPYGCTGSLQDKRLKRDPFHRSVPYPGGCPELKSLFSYCGPAIYPGALPW